MVLVQGQNCDDMSFTCYHEVLIKVCNTNTAVVKDKTNRPICE